MKIATNTLYELIRERTGNTSQAVNEAVDTVTTGRAITQLSDDPFRLTQMLDTQAELSSIEQYQRNIEMGEVWLNTSEIGMSGVQESLVDVYSNAIQLSNDNVNEDDRESGAEDVEEKILDMLEVANTDVNGRYIFGGTSTDEPPFILVNDRGEEVDVEQATRVKYVGDKTPFQIKTNEYQSLDVGNDGSEIFGTMFETLLTLRDALRDNDVDGITAQIDVVNEEAENISAFISATGQKMNRLTFRSSILEDLDLAKQEQFSDIAEVDITEAITDLRIKELAYQAALSASSIVINMGTLMDHI